jgi:hypothetical protein
MPTAEVTDYQTVPAGVYAAVLKEVEEKVSQAAGDLYWRWTFEVLKGPCAGAAIRANSSPKLSPKSKARGWAEAIIGRKLTTGERLDTEELINRNCQLVVKTQDRDGATFNDVSEVLPHDDLPF